MFAKKKAYRPPAWGMDETARNWLFGASVALLSVITFLFIFLY